MRPPSTCRHAISTGVSFVDVNSRRCCNEPGGVDCLSTNCRLVLTQFPIFAINVLPFSPRSRCGESDLPTAVSRPLFSPSPLATGPAVNTSLVCLMLALSTSWTAPWAAVPDNFGPTPAVFARAEPYGLFDQLLDDLPTDRTDARIADARSLGQSFAIGVQP